MRIDRWIRKNLANLPQGLIEKNLRSGKIKVNNKKIKSSYKVKANEQIEIYNFNFKIKVKQEKKKLNPTNNVIK